MRTVVLTSEGFEVFLAERDKAEAERLARLALAKEVAKEAKKQARRADRAAKQAKEKEKKDELRLEVKESKAKERADAKAVADAKKEKERKAKADELLVKKRNAAYLQEANRSVRALNMRANAIQRTIKGPRKKAKRGVK